MRDPVLRLTFSLESDSLYQHLVDISKSYVQNGNANRNDIHEQVRSELRITEVFAEVIITMTLVFFAKALIGPNSMFFESWYLVECCVFLKLLNVNFVGYVAEIKHLNCLAISLGRE